MTTGHCSPATRRGENPYAGIDNACVQVVGPMLDVFHLKFYAHDFFFRPRASAQGPARLSNGFTLLSVSSSFFMTSVILAVFGSTSTRTYRGRRLDALIARATCRWREIARPSTTRRLVRRRLMTRPCQIVLWGELGHAPSYGVGDQVPARCRNSGSGRFQNMRFSSICPCCVPP